MAATYDELQPTDKDWLRGQIGDVIGLPDGALFSDEVYSNRLATYPSREAAGVALLRELVSRFSQQADAISIAGEFSISWKHRIPEWNALLAQWSTSGATGTTGGFVSVAAVRDVIIPAEYVPPERPERY